MKVSLEKNDNAWLAPSPSSNQPTGLRPFRQGSDGQKSRMWSLIAEPAVFKRRKFVKIGLN